MIMLIQYIFTLCKVSVKKHDDKCVDYIHVIYYYRYMYLILCCLARHMSTPWFSCVQPSVLVVSDVL